MGRLALLTARAPQEPTCLRKCMRAHKLMQMEDIKRTCKVYTVIGPMLNDCVISFQGSLTIFTHRVYFVNSLFIHIHLLLQFM